MKSSRTQAIGSAIAGMGGYGCMMYNATGAATTFAPQIENRHIVAVQAMTDTTVESVAADWMAPADVGGLEIPAGNCLFVKAASVTITDGVGVLYFGLGEAVEAEEAGGD